MSPPRARLLTIKEAAEELCVSVPMIYKLTRTGALPVVKIMSACRIDPRDLEEFIEQRRGRQAAG